MRSFEPREDIKKKLIELAKNGKMTCAEAHQLAESEGVSLIIIGEVAEEAGVKICDCQLGCFGKYKER
jgi:translation initiation factor IF-3